MGVSAGWRRDGGGGSGGSTGLLTPLMSSQLVYGDGVDDIKVNKHTHTH